MALMPNGAGKVGTIAALADIECVGEKAIDETGITA